MTDEKKALSVNPTLAPHQEITPEDTVAKQGPPPADFAGRPQSALPLFPVVKLFRLMRWRP